MKTKIFKKMVNIYFCIGVNVIGLPQYHRHQIRYYKLETRY